MNTLPVTLRRQILDELEKGHHLDQIVLETTGLGDGVDDSSGHLCCFHILRLVLSLFSTSLHVV